MSGVIEIGAATIGMWCVELPERQGNWLAHLARLPNGKFALDYRFRYYVDEKVHESADRRNWYHGELTAISEAEVLRKLRSIFDDMLLHADAGWELLKGERTVEEFAEAAQSDAEHSRARGESAMSVPTGIGNLPPGVTDNDPHFDGDDACLHCEKRQREPGSDYCGDCENELSEAAYERRMEDGETFRGGEAAAYYAEEQARIQRELK